MVRNGSVHPASGTRRSVALLAAVAIAFATVVACTPPVPGGLAARDGLSPETAAPSCWSIKQYYPESEDGTYWLWTPQLVHPQQLHCDMTTDGGGWVLIGRGREGWDFEHWGAGTPEQVRSPMTGPEAFEPAALPAPTIDGLLGGRRVDQLNDGIRLRRARDVDGTSWQEVVMRVKVGTTDSWTWAMGGGIPLGAITFDGVRTPIGFSNYQTNTTHDITITNGERRVFTYRWPEHLFQAGFSYGASVVGSNSPTSYLWQAGVENHAIPFTQVYIRPILYDADVAGGPHAPDEGLPPDTVSPMLDRHPVDQPWGVTGFDAGTAIPGLGTYVRTAAQIGDTVYLGGKFLRVQHGAGGPTFEQSYLAAFHVDTGEWIPDFAPEIDAPVWALAAAPDGSKLFVAGEFSAVNGAPNTSALAALDPATGAVVTDWVGFASRPEPQYDVRALDLEGDWLYAGGNFTRVSGGAGAELTGPIMVGRMARLRVSDGRPDPTWKPHFDTSPWDVDASTQGDRVYVVGGFTRLDGVPLAVTHLAVIDTVTGALVPGLQPWQPNSPDTTEAQNVVLEVGDKVYQGGAQHILHQYARDDYSLERSQFTKTAGGDYQAIAVKDGIVYASCHCTDWQYQDTNSWPLPEGYTELNGIQLIGAYDQDDALEQIPEFQPPRDRVRGAAGPWELFLDSRGCMWAVGDMPRPGSTSAAFYGGWERFCDRDAVAPATPTGATAAVDGTTVTLTWAAAADDRPGPVVYEVLKDHSTFGTVVVATTEDVGFTDELLSGESARYFVRTRDAEGNRSASTPVVTATVP